MDELIEEYAKILQEIYDSQSAGDYTFKGILHEFARKIVPDVIPPMPNEYRWCRNNNGHDEHFWHEPQDDNSVKKWRCRGN